MQETTMTIDQKLCRNHQAVVSLTKCVFEGPGIELDITAGPFSADKKQMQVDTNDMIGERSQFEGNWKTIRKNRGKSLILDSTDVTDLHIRHPTADPSFSLVQVGQNCQA